MPVTIWNDDVGTAVLTLPVGTALTVVGKLTSREWNTRLYLELLADHVAAAVVTPGEGREPMPRPGPAPRRSALGGAINGPGEVGCALLSLQAITATDPPLSAAGH